MPDSVHLGWILLYAPIKDSYNIPNCIPAKDGKEDVKEEPSHNRNPFNRGLDKDEYLMIILG